MWRLWIGLGGLLWLLTVSSSIAMNAYTGYRLGQTPIEATIFAALGVAADGWKALAPIFIAALLRKRQFVVASTATAMWLVCFAFAVTAAMGLAAENRNAATGGREAQQAALHAALREADEIDTARAARLQARGVKEVEAEIAAVFARVVPNHGTVGSVSAECSKETWRAAKACAEIATLRIELARSVATERDEARLAAIRSEIARMQAAGAQLEVDAQAKLIGRVTRGLIAAKDVGLVVVLLLVAMIELVSAFAPIVLSEFARVTRTDRVSPPAEITAMPTGTVGEIPSGDIYAFMAERLRPKQGNLLTRAALASAYRDWCAESRIAPLERQAFESAFESVCANDLGDSIKVTAAGYRNCELVGAPPRLINAKA